MADSTQNIIADYIRADAAIMALLPGLVWTRRIRRNTNPAGVPPTPGSTPEAFDSRDRILRCASILPGGPRAFNPLGPSGAYFGFPEIYLRCLPHEAEKQLLQEAMRLVTNRLTDAVVTGPAGEGLVLRIAARVDPDDDDDLPPAVVGMLQVQIDSIWR